MAIKIRANENIHGLSFEKNCSYSKEIKLLSYADDVTLTLKNNDDLLYAINDVLDFSKISGLKLNEKKSLGMWIGSSKDKSATPGNISWVPKGQNLKILGIYFNSIIEASENSMNWDSKILEIEKNIRYLHKRRASLYGKVILCKTFLFSKISNILLSLSLPKKILEKIDTLLFKFIWQKKFSESKAREKIKRSVLCRSVSEGGLGMIRTSDQQRVFLLRWMNKIASDNISLYKTSKIADIYFEEFGGIKYFLSSSKANKINTCSKFWNDVMNIWLLAKTNITNNQTIVTNIYSEPLFNNSQVTYKGNILFFKRWIDNEVKYISDMISNNKIRSLEDIKARVGSYPGLILDYNALTNSIPKLWKEKICSNDNMCQEYILVNPVIEKVFSLCKMKNNIIRAALASDSSSEACGRGFWLRKFNIDIKENYLSAIHATKESRLRLLHFKLLHNIYPTNILLHRMGIKKSENCDFCGEKDFVEHMFVYCSKINAFWDTISSLIYRQTQVKFNLTASDILLGISSDKNKLKKHMNIANHIILIAKMCIGKLRYGGMSDIFLIFDLEWSLRKKIFSI